MPLGADVCCFEEHGLEVVEVDAVGADVGDFHGEWDGVVEDEERPVELCAGLAC